MAGNARITSGLPTIWMERGRSLPRSPFPDRETKRCRLLDFFRIADYSEISGCLKLGIKLYMEEESLQSKWLPH
jgi:hypothetical protein